MAATRALVKEYFDLFVNRRAYTVQSFRPHPESGRHYYYRPRERGTGAALLLNERTISDHLEGKITIGLYAINPSNQRCRWVAIDADYTNAMEDLIKLQYHLSGDRVDSALEISRRGGHLWVFLAAPLLARKCRMMREKMSTGTGKATVVFFSTPISGSVCRYRSGTLTGCSASKLAASTNRCAAEYSLSAWMIFDRFSRSASACLAMARSIDSG